MISLALPAAFLRSRFTGTTDNAAITERVYRRVIHKKLVNAYSKSAGDVLKCIGILHCVGLKFRETHLQTLTLRLPRECILSSYGHTSLLSTDYVPDFRHIGANVVCQDHPQRVRGIGIEWKGSGVDERGMDRDTGRTLVEIDPRYFRPTEVERLQGDASKAAELLGWKPRISFKELIKRMVVADLREAEKEQLFQRAGFQ